MVYFLICNVSWVLKRTVSTKRLFLCIQTHIFVRIGPYEKAQVLKFGTSYAPKTECRVTPIPLGKCKRINAALKKCFYMSTVSAFIASRCKSFGNGS